MSDKKTNPQDPVFRMVKARAAQALAERRRKRAQQEDHEKRYQAYLLAKALDDVGIYWDYEHEYNHGPPFIDGVAFAGKPNAETATKVKLHVLIMCLKCCKVLHSPEIKELADLGELLEELRVEDDHKADCFHHSLVLYVPGMDCKDARDRHRGRSIEL